VRHTRIRTRRGRPRFTHLAACVSEEEGSFTVHVRLYHEAKPENRAWGEEVADSFEAASAILGDLASALSIPQTNIKISVRMENVREGTRH
jgi:protein-disulfide isomerase